MFEGTDSVFTINQSIYLPHNITLQDSLIYILIYYNNIGPILQSIIC